MSPRVSGPFKITRLPKKNPKLPRGWGGGGVLGHELEREVRRVIDFGICDLKSLVGFLSGVFLGDKRF